MRTFIALDFDRQTKKRLGKIQRKLKQNSSKGSWVYIDNFHITLKFLGTTDSSRIDEIATELQSIAHTNEEIKLSIDDLDYFRGENILRVVWLGLQGERQSILDIKKDIDDKMNNLGFPKEKKDFIPHITLGRRVIFNNRIHSIKEQLKDDLNYNFTLKKLVLYKSEVKDKKRIYTQLKSFNLKKE